MTLAKATIDFEYYEFSPPLWAQVACYVAALAVVVTVVVLWRRHRKNGQKP